jgi:hypothetical protein
MDNLEKILKDSIRILRLSNDSIKAEAFDIINNGYKQNETIEYKSDFINNIIMNFNVLDSFKLDDIIKLIIFANNIEVKGELYDKILNEIYDDVPESKYGVHATHCCVEHGCKYGNPKCPVVLGKVKQAYPCADCNLDIIYPI